MLTKLLSFFISFLFFVFLFVKYHSANRTCRNDQDTYKWKDWCIITCFYGTLSVRCRCKICSRSSHFGFCDAERYLSGIHLSLIHISIDGKIHKDFFDTDTVQNMNFNDSDYCHWQELKSYCFSIIRGKLLPIQMCIRDRREST